jgi:hypothetical protein
VASSSVSWITVANTSSQSGPATVGYTVAANTTSSPRTGTLSIADQTFTVTQAPASVTDAPAPVVIARLINPTDGATDVNPKNNFTWTNVSSSEGYRLQLGASYGSSELLDSSTISRTWLSVQKLNLPRRQTLYARLWTRAGGVWRSSDSTFALR